MDFGGDNSTHNRGVGRSQDSWCVSLGNLPQGDRVTDEPWRRPHCQRGSCTGPAWERWWWSQPQGAEFKFGVRLGSRAYHPHALICRGMWSERTKEPLVLTWGHISIPTTGFIKTVSGTVSLEWGPGICISNKLPYDPAIPLVDTYTKVLKAGSWTSIYTPMNNRVSSA